MIRVYCTSSIYWSESIRLLPLGGSLRVNSKLVFSSQTIFLGTSRGTLIWDITSRHIIKLKCASDVLAQEFSWGVSTHQL